MPSDRSSVSPASPDTPSDGSLVRGIGLWQATALNMIDMIGVGPFVTIPLIIATMHGPQAMLGWILGRPAVRVRRPGLGGARRGDAAGRRPGSVSARDVRPTGRRVARIPVRLSVDVQRAAVDGVRCIGFAQYAEYLWPALHNTITSQRFALAIPGRRQHRR